MVLSNTAWTSLGVFFIVDLEEIPTGGYSVLMVIVDDSMVSRLEVVLLEAGDCTYLSACVRQ